MKLIRNLVFFIILLIITIGFSACGYIFGKDVKQDVISDNKDNKVNILRTTVWYKGGIVKYWDDNLDSVKLTKELVEYRAAQADSIIVAIEKFK